MNGQVDNLSTIVSSFKNPLLPIHCINIIEAFILLNIVYVTIFTVAQEKQSSRTSFGTIKALTLKDGCLCYYVSGRFRGTDVFVDQLLLEHNK